MESSKENTLTYAARSSSSDVSERDDAMERWRPRWELVFAGILLLAMVASLGDGAATWQARMAGVAVAATLVGWYGFWRSRSLWHHTAEDTGRVAVYLLGATAFFIVLTTIHPAYMLLTFCLYWQVYGFLPLKSASAAAAMLTVVVAWRSGLIGGQPFTIDPAFFTILVAGLAVSGIFGWWIGALIHESTERKRLITDLQATRQELAAAERRAGILNERQRLAHEIHDTLAQDFVSIVMSLEAAQSSLAAAETESRLQMERAQRAAREGLAEARRLVWALTPEPLQDATLPDALRRVAGAWSETTGIATTVAVTGDTFRAHPEMEIALLRSAQEALANILKHARASEAAITLSYMDEAIALDVIDNGVGFDAAQVPAPDGERGFGLQGMRSRAHALGGTLAVESDPGFGTAIAISLPLVTPTNGSSDRNAIPERSRL